MMDSWMLTSVLLTICLVFSASAQVESNGEPSSLNGTGKETPQGKAFSIFSVVQFKNTGCRSQSTMTSGQSPYRNGTCFTSSECSSKGGTASGNCASGFGVCCIFLVSATGSTINQNCTYIRNPSFPSAYTATGSLSYTINKCSADICWLRLDFESFQILGPSSTTEPTGGSCPDTFIVTTATGPTSLIPTICGTNTGQHLYIDMGNVATDTSTLAFTFTGTSTTRLWEIKVSQISCFNANRPPGGCEQYYTTLTGRITTFNFQSTSSNHLANQEQTVCIRQAQGYCCVEYQVCADQTNPWTLDRVIGAFAAATSGLVDSACLMDYTSIPGSTSGQCNSRVSGQFNRYCGAYLGLSNLGTANQPICDCTAPFLVNFHTDAIQDAGAAIAPAGRGVCLDYMQVPCNS